MVLEGKAYWCNLKEPNKFYGYYGLLLTLNKTKYLQLKKEGYQVKDTEWGYCLNIKTKPKEGYKPILVNRKEKKLKMFGEIANGSNVKVRLEPWETDNRYGHFKGFTLIAVMLLDEVPKLLYEPLVWVLCPKSLRVIAKCILLLVIAKVY
jgi:hypothetical protein